MGDIVIANEVVHYTKKLKKSLLDLKLILKEFIRFKTDFKEVEWECCCDVYDEVSCLVEEFDYGMY